MILERIGPWCRGVYDGGPKSQPSDLVFGDSIGLSRVLAGPLDPPGKRM